MTFNMLSLVLALAMLPSVCPMTIGIGADGALSSSRFHGWYKVTARTIESDLRGGCYNDANPSKVTSVKVLIAPGAPKQRVDSVFSILKTKGWGRDKVDVESWRTYPRAP
jgi:hypothetical protein